MESVEKTIIKEVIDALTETLEGMENEEIFELTQEDISDSLIYNELNDEERKVAYTFVTEYEDLLPSFRIIEHLYVLTKIISSLTEPEDEPINALKIINAIYHDIAMVDGSEIIIKIEER